MILTAVLHAIQQINLSKYYLLYDVWKINRVISTSKILCEGISKQVRPRLESVNMAFLKDLYLFFESFIYQYSYYLDKRIIQKSNKLIFD